MEEDEFDLHKLTPDELHHEKTEITYADVTFKDTVNELSIVVPLFKLPSANWLIYDQLSTYFTKNYPKLPNRTLAIYMDRLFELTFVNMVHSLFITGKNRLWYRWLPLRQPCDMDHVNLYDFRLTVYRDGEPPLTGISISSDNDSTEYYVHRTVFAIIGEEGQQRYLQLGDATIGPDFLTKNQMTTLVIRINDGEKVWLRNYGY